MSHSPSDEARYPQRLLFALTQDWIMLSNPHSSLQVGVSQARAVINPAIIILLARTSIVLVIPLERRFHIEEMHSQLLSRT